MLIFPVVSEADVTTPEAVIAAAPTVPVNVGEASKAYWASVEPPSASALPVVPANTAIRLSTDEAGPRTTSAAATPESAMSLPVVPLYDAMRPVVAEAGPVTTLNDETPESLITFVAADSIAILP